ncbi:MAG: glycosyltransferase [Bdellovibrionales bacterium]
MRRRIAKRSLDVSVCLEVYNEEQRLEACLKCFEWAKELVVFDKCSTDNTVAIARKYGAKVVTVPRTSASENYEIWGQHLSCEWTLSITASSLIHPEVVYQIEKYVSDTNFAYDVIGLPFGMYVFGVRSKYSAWYAKNKLTLIRTSVLRFSNELHKEVSFASDKVFTLQTTKADEVLYHLTHENLGTFMDRITRYAAYEANWIYEQNQGKNRNKRLAESFYKIFKGLAILVLKRRFFMMGIDGCVMALAYLLSLSCSTVYLWERYRVGHSGPQVYSEIRRKLSDLWDDEFKSRA